MLYIMGLTNLLNLFQADNINIGIQREVETIKRGSKQSYNWIYWWISSLPQNIPTQISVQQGIIWVFCWGLAI